MKPVKVIINKDIFLDGEREMLNKVTATNRGTRVDYKNHKYFFHKKSDAMKMASAIIYGGKIVVKPRTIEKEQQRKYNIVIKPKQSFYGQVAYASGGDDE